MPKLIEFKNVKKVFGTCIANHNVSFSVERGTIHAIVGENGAGKSTIMKILFGMHQRDEGQIFLNGEEVHFKTPAQAKKAKIGMVHQHFMLAGSMIALDHFFLERSTSIWRNLFSPLDRKALHQQLLALSEKFLMPVPWFEKISDLSVGIQQRIEVLKLLYEHADILIFDEPTAVLTPHEVEAFFQQLKNLQSQGKTILLITHKLKEVMAIAENVTVFRKGETVGTQAVKDLNEDKLAHLMIGKALQKVQKVPYAGSEKKLVSVQNLNLLQKDKKLLQSLNFQIRAGEILGIAGVEGNGQSELIRALIRPQDFAKNISGEVQILSASTLSLQTHNIRSLGVACLPENRQKQALLMDKSAKDNFLLGYQDSPRYQKRGILNSARVDEAVALAFQNLDIRPNLPDLSIQDFSGGNQQKLVVAREVQASPAFLIASQPTRGVDIGSIQNIHREILKLKEQGSAILLISSELSEILDLSDRVLVFFEGKIVADLPNENLNEEILGSYMGGLS